MSRHSTTIIPSAAFRRLGPFDAQGVRGAFRSSLPVRSAVPRPRRGRPPPRDVGRRWCPRGDESHPPPAVGRRASARAVGPGSGRDGPIVRPGGRAGGAGRVGRPHETVRYGPAGAGPSGVRRRPGGRRRRAVRRDGVRPLGAGLGAEQPDLDPGKRNLEPVLSGTLSARAGRGCHDVRPAAGRGAARRCDARRGRGGARGTDLGVPRCGLDRPLLGGHWEPAGDGGGEPGVRPGRPRGGPGPGGTGTPRRAPDGRAIRRGCSRTGPGRTRPTP